MKKVIIAIACLLILACAASYIFIPSNLKIANVIVIKCTSGNVNTALQKIFQNDMQQNGFSFHLAQPFSDGALIEMKKGDDQYHSRIQTISNAADSVTVEWVDTIQSGWNPLKRWSQYNKAVNAKETMQALLDSIKNFASNTANIYGFNIRRTTFTDTLLIATKFTSPVYPTQEIIYKAIGILRKNIAAQGATAKDAPMVNVNQIDSNSYETMIAICVDREMKPDKNTYIKRMVNMQDRFLTTEVTGGLATVEQAHNAIRKYMEDRFLTAPAIPFEIFVTDRSVETDTSKWKTVIFHPSM